MKIEITKEFRLLREFQIQSSARFAEFHQALGLPLTLEMTESSAAFEAAIESAAYISFRWVAMKEPVRFVIECELIESADRSMWFYEDTNLMTGLQGCPDNIGDGDGMVYVYRELWDLYKQIPRGFDYVLMELCETAGVESNRFIYVPFDDVRFYVRAL